jgi:O-antigen ligase
MKNAPTNFLLTNALILFLILISGNKLFLLGFVGAGIFLLLFSKQKYISVIFSLLLFSLPFERGIRGWFLQVVSPGPESWMPGYSFYFGLSVKIVLFILFMLLLVFHRKTNLMSSKWHLHDVFLIIFLGLAILSTYFSSDLLISGVGLISLVAAVGLYFISTIIIHDADIKIEIPQLGMIWLFWFGIIGTAQFILRHPVGLFLEETTLTRPNGFYTTDGDLLYRVSGLTGHPTFFGSLLSLLIPISIGILIEQFQKNQNRGLYFFYVIAAIIFGVISLFATYSRSAWISAVFVIGLLGYKLLVIKNSRLKHTVTIGLFSVICIIILLFGGSVFARLFTLADMANLGNATGRINLIKHAIQITSDFPVFGSGLNQFTRQLITHNLTIDERVFFYPVHNTFLLFFSELGIPAGVCFVLFVLAILITSIKTTFNSSWVGWGVWIGAFTFIINAQFQTLFNLDPTFDIFMLLCAYLASQKL